LRVALKEIRLDMLRIMDVNGIPGDRLIATDYQMKFAVEALSDLTISKLLLLIGDRAETRAEGTIAQKQSLDFLTPESIIWIPRMTAKVILSLGFGTPVGLVLLGLLWATVGAAKLSGVVAALGQVIPIQGFVLAQAGASGTPKR
jgi:hypothetical protein